MARVYRDRLISDLNDEAAKVKTEIELAQKQVSQLSMDLADKGLQGKAYDAVQKHLDSQRLVAKSQLVYVPEDNDFTNWFYIKHPEKFEGQTWR